jgi:hypothetical protein
MATKILHEKPVAERTEHHQSLQRFGAASVPGATLIPRQIEGAKELKGRKSNNKNGGYCPISFG